MPSRVYICHTFYHVYISAVKELNRGARGEATLILSTMSNNFGDLKERAERTGLFADVYMFDEKEDVTSEEVMSYHRNRGNVFANLLQRITYTKLLGKLQEPYVPVDLKAYKDIYIFCDSDPIGYYMNYKKIYYHSVEEGLDTAVDSDTARYSNNGFFPLKRLMSKMGLIFIENGYGRYCIDFEVNDISRQPFPIKNLVEANRDEMFAKLSRDDKKILVDMFLDNPKELMEQLSALDKSKENVMILSEPLCDMDTRHRIFQDIIDEYSDTCNIIIKPHPRDLLDYENDFSDAVIIKGRFPMEVMNDIDGLTIDTLVSVFTPLENIRFAKNKIMLGPDFMDKYEEPSIHRINDYVK